MCECVDIYIDVCTGFTVYIKIALNQYAINIVNTYRNPSLSHMQIYASMEVSMPACVHVSRTSQPSQLHLRAVGGGSELHFRDHAYSRARNDAGYLDKPITSQTLIGRANNNHISVSKSVVSYFSQSVAPYFIRSVVLYFS